jgi:hypothetical protein
MPNGRTEMLIGGVLLAAGTELRLIPGDYDGDREIRFVVSQVVAWGADWVCVAGRELASATGPWRTTRYRVRTAALKRSLAL